MGHAPCKTCHLSPCHRRNMCPKYRKWEREHKRQKAIADAAKAEESNYIGYFVDNISKRKR